MLDDRAFYVDIFGLHALYRRPIDAGDLEASLHGLAEALGLHVAALATRFTHCREFQMQDARQTLAPIRVTLTIRGAWHELLLYEQWDTIRGYGAETIDALVRGLCRIVEPHLARSFRGSAPAFLSERECDGRLARLDWLQYFGPTLMERLGIARVETGLFFRVEPTGSGGCFVRTRVVPAQPDHVGCGRPHTPPDTRDGPGAARRVRAPAPVVDPTRSALTLTLRFSPTDDTDTPNALVNVV